MLLVATGTAQRRGVTLILHDSSQPATTIVMIGRRKVCAKLNLERKMPFPTTGHALIAGSHPQAGFHSAGSARQRAQDARQRAVVHQRGRALDVGREVAVGRHRRARARAAARAPPRARGELAQRAQEFDALRGRQQLDAEDVRGVARSSAAAGARRRSPSTTWSSWLAEVGRLSTLAGCASDLFSRGQRRRGHVRDHEAAVEPGVGGRGTAAGARRRRRSASRCAARRSRRPRRSRAPWRRRRGPPARRGSCRPR